MSRRMKLILAFGIGTAAVLGSAGVAHAMLQDASAELRATGQAGEQADGYMGIVGSASADLRAKVDAVNIQRRAAYTELAGRRGVTIEEAAAATACQIFASRVRPGQFYRLPGGAWQKHDGGAVPRPSYCG